VATSVITGTITDGAGAAVSGVTVLCTLKPYGYRITEATAISARQSTTSNASGVYTFTLEEQSNITPQGSYYEIEEQIPVASGGRRVWIITVGASDAAVAASLLANVPDQGAPDYLTQAQGDSRYAQTADIVLKAGSTMTGELTLSTSSPTSALKAASKGYVDTALASASVSGESDQIVIAVEVFS
jgi:hypothetical protein